MMHDIKIITDNKHTQKIFKPFLSEKSKTSSCSNDGMVAEEFSLFFENAFKCLNISPQNLILGNTTNLINPAEIAVRKF